MGSYDDHRCPYRKEAEGNLTTEAGDVMMEARGWSDLSRSYEQRNVGSFQKLEVRKTRKQILPSETAEGSCPVNTLTLAQWDWFQISGLQSYKRRHL